MKIALVSPYDFGYHGGVVTHISQLSEQLQKIGHVVKILAPLDSSSDVRQENLIPIGRPVPVPAGGSIARISLSIWRERRVRALLKEENFDVLHVHEPLAPILPLSVINSSETANVGTFHAFHGRGYMYFFSKGLMKRWFDRLDSLIAVSEPAKDYVSNAFPGDYNIIPNGIDVQFFSRNVAPFDAFKDGKLNILFVGRMEKRKGLKYLLQAYGRLKWEHPEIRLIVVGPGNPGNDNYRIISERNLQDVVFVGRVTDDQKRRYFQTADIFCAPNTGKESFGIVLCEAMASGRPIVASDIPGFDSVVTNGKEGLLVPPKDDEAIYLALKQLIESPSRRLSMGERGSTSVKAYSWHKLMPKIVDCYHQAISHHSSRLLKSRAVTH
ncbi:MAG: phosphatidylinositol alpha-mannosyltransferase [Chloroflexi bacterium]|jgi:phosphatidylinositol alpha-mannosyltransferase|nr:MAG: phosphatidylinositol alpha-mannosyltransferase [Chloroflexota bacterium]